MIFGKPWSKEELYILESFPKTHSFITIQNALKQKGFDRTVGAIERKLQRLDKKVLVVDVLPTKIHKPSSVKWHTGSLGLISPETRFVMLNDVHVPHHIPMGNIWKFCEDFKPHYLLLVGDIVNNDPFSHWDRKSPLRFKSMPQPKQYYESCNIEFFRPARQAVGRDCNIGYWIGNHEYWSNKAIQEMPEGEGYWEVENNIEEIDFWVPSKQLANLGKLHFLHGDAIQGGRHHSLKMLNYYRRNLRYGHYHNLELSSYTSPIDVEDRHTARCCGTLEKPNPGFMANRPHDWMACVTYGVVLPNGNFFDDTAVITNNSFMANGKIYKGD